LPDFRRFINLGGAAVASVEPGKAGKVMEKFRRTPAGRCMRALRESDRDSLTRLLALIG